MRILRIRRGYTTNSSGANEWVPPPDAKYNPPQKSQAERQVTVLATQPAAGDAKAGGEQPAPVSGLGASNLGLMAILFGAVCLLFGFTAWLRRRLRRRRR